jgi:hypothetical protein
MKTFGPAERAAFGEPGDALTRRMFRRHCHRWMLPRLSSGNVHL